MAGPARYGCPLWRGVHPEHRRYALRTLTERHHDGDPYDETGSGDLLIWGHTRLAETLLRHGLVDLIDLSIHPMVVGHGGLLFRDGLEVPLRLVSAKVFSHIVKVTYQVQARP
jgi:dihydrofolate reductase